MDQKDYTKLHMLLVGRIYQEQQVFQAINNVVKTIYLLKPDTIFYFMDQKTLSKIKSKDQTFNCQLFAKEKHQNLLTYVITIGGDGTILYAAKQLKNCSPPIISFQRGTLGFMCKFTLNRIKQVINAAVKATSMNQNSPEFPFIVNKLMRLKSQKKVIGDEYLNNQINLCVNEVFVSRPQCQRIILEIQVDGEFMTQTAGDGILISTPTGSTAYSLSAGGPIMQNGVNGILIVPIAPNSLSFRPICIPSSCKIVLRVSKKSRSDAYISYDGQKNEAFTKDDQLIISKSDNDIKFYEPKSQEMSQLPTWINRLKHFLGWNQSFKPLTCSEGDYQQTNKN